MKHKIEQVKVADLTPYSGNARVHDDAQVQQIANSIAEFGFNAPILIDGEGVIIAGHGRAKAAQVLGLETVPAIRLTHLTDVQRRAYILADNKIALNSSWDADLLTLELDQLDELGVDMALMGFSDDDFTTDDAPAADDSAGGTSGFDGGDDGETRQPEPRATKTTDGFVEFAIVMEAENKEVLMRAINAVKKDHGIEKNEDALMIMVRDYAS